MRVNDRAEIMAVALSSGLFSTDEMPVFAESFDGWTPDGKNDPRLWLIADDGSGAALVVPEVMSDHVWKLLFIGVAVDRHRSGVGRALVAEVERRVAQVCGRMLLVDTASGDNQFPARSFYAAIGYRQVAVIPDYYGDGIDRVSFARRL